MPQPGHPVPGSSLRSLLRPTPFHERTAPLVRAETWRRWAGCQVASAYDPQPSREYAALRNAAAVIDISPLYKYLIHGRDAERLLDRVVTRDVTRCAVGQVMYTPWCNDAGKVIDDGTLSRLNETTFRLTSAEPNLRWLTSSAIGLDVVIEDVTERTAALAIQGPNAGAVIARVAQADIEQLRFFRLVETRILNTPVVISRTGYTGDLGYEVWVDAPLALGVWDAILDAGDDYGITPVGIWALDIARIEAGLLMLDVDYTSAHRALTPEQFSSPFELGLGWAVSATKGPFTGRAALADERKHGSAWQFVGLDVQWASLEAQYRKRGLPTSLPGIAWRGSVAIFRDARQVGYATSGCWSPLLGQDIALARVMTPHAKPGTPVEVDLMVEHSPRRVAASICALPFFDPPRKRA